MAVDMFIKIDDVKGEAADDKHKGEIDVLAWSWGASQSGSMHVGGGGGSGKASFQDLSFTKYVDKATPMLLKVCANGKHFDQALLTVRKAGEKPVEYIKLTLKHVLVSSISTGGSGGEDRLTENVTLNFEEFEFGYTPQKADGTPEGTLPCKWSISKNAEP
jgi:type VI secretion system secreted protein Hcp